ncbi:MFS transporter [Nocardia altamirensis]|uniref:MFS transporter n=1 Tax=Nocardia altamirensis TaxID=472158 RepID=UPI0008405DEB|nr:MFS transporter [Nocardia altamirensis]
MRLSPLAFAFDNRQTTTVVGWSLVARLPTGMIGLSIPLIGLAAESSPTVAGAALAVYRIAQAATTPLWGRAADRVPLRVLLRTAPIGFGVFVALLASCAAQPALLISAAMILGCLTLPYSAFLRTLWNRQYDEPDKLLSANAFESFMTEAVLLGGRALLALAALAFPLHAIVAGQAFLSIVGGVALSVTARVRADRPMPPQIDGGTRAPRPSTPAVAPLFAAFTLFAAALGAVALSLVVVMHARPHGAVLGSIAVALWGLGSLAGLEPLTRLSIRRFRFPGPLMMAVTAVIVWLLAILAAAHWPVVLWLAFAAGTPIAVAISALYGSLESVTPHNRQAEFFSWAMTAILAGDAAGTVVAGAVLDWTQWQGSGFVVAGAMAAIASVLAVSARPDPERTDRPSGADSL